MASLHDLKHALSSLHDTADTLAAAICCCTPTPNSNNNAPCAAAAAEKENAPLAGCDDGVRAGSGGLDDAPPSDSRATRDLQHELRLLAREKDRLQQHRDQLASERGLHKGRIAQLEGAVAANERRVRMVLAELEQVKEECGRLRSQLQQAEQQLDTTPQRCREATQKLQAEADRARGRAHTQEVHADRLRQLVQHEAQERLELVEFTEQERQMLVELQCGLQEQLSQALTRGEATTAEMEQLKQLLRDQQQNAEALTAQVSQAMADKQLLEGRLEEQALQLTDAKTQQQDACCARDAAASSAQQAQQEASAAQEQCRRIFRQVRFVSHVLDKNSALLGRAPELQGLARELRALVASAPPCTAGASADLPQPAEGGSSGSAGLQDDGHGALKGGPQAAAALPGRSTSGHLQEVAVNGAS